MSYGGIVLCFRDLVRAEVIEKRVQSGKSFTEVVSVPDIRPEPFDTCVLTFNQRSLSYFCLVQRKRKKGTTQQQLSSIEIVPLGSLAFGKFSLPIVRKFLTRSEKFGSVRASPDEWQNLLMLLKALCPDVADRVDELERRRENVIQAFEGKTFETIALEKDAVGLALEIFGSDRKKVLFEKHPSTDVAPFLQGLTSSRLREDTMISHDASVFPEWAKVADHQIGALEFTNGDQRLTIINVNRHPIEKTLGVDLIYYHHVYNAYVLIQYKRMIQESNSTWGFRPNEDQCMLELGRMRAFNSNNPYNAEAIVLNEYRLNPEAFYFKLCESITYSPMSPDLILGMYIPLDYWETLLNSQDIKGPNGGLRITKENICRHLNNTEFVSLVKHGWIGSRQNRTTELTSIINQLLSEDHSVIVAASAKDKS